MAYSAKNKELIEYFMNRPKENYDEYIIENKSTYRLAEEWGLSKSTVYSILKKQGFIGIKIKDKITSCNEELFNKDNPIFCYLAGLISADGYIDNKNHRVILRMCIDAKEILEKLRDYFSISSEVSSYTGIGGYTEFHTMYNLTISSRKLIEELEKLRIVGRKKDLLIRFPDMSMLNEECQEMFIRGLWDGDGTAYTNSCSTDILEESELMINAIKEFLESKNIYSKYSTYTNYNQIILLKDDTIKLVNWMYKHNLDFKINYKYNRFLSNI